jgi:hypothetical protein
MPNTSAPFAHRTNRDGTIDSICKTCFVTVGTALEAPPLRDIEDRHTCDPWKLEVVRIVTAKNSRTSDA